MNSQDTAMFEFSRQLAEITHQYREAARRKLPPHKFKITEREGERVRETLSRVCEITDLVGATVHIVLDEIWVAAKDAETLDAARLAL